MWLKKDQERIIPKIIRLRINRPLKYNFGAHCVWYLLSSILSQKAIAKILEKTQYESQKAKNEPNGPWPMAGTKTPAHGI